MNLYQIKNVLFLFIAFSVAILLAVYACSGDTGYKPVDFSERRVVKRPVGQTSDSSQLKVAVAAVISPKETFVYYRQLLDYLAHHLGRNVQLIQRKTYSEINELFPKGQIDLAFICSGPYAVSKDPMTHDLLVSVLREVDVAVERVIITDVRTSTYYAELVLSDGEDTRTLDCRPSDAIAIALRTRSAILIPEDLLDRLDEQRKDSGVELSPGAGSTFADHGDSTVH